MNAATRTTCICLLACLFPWHLARAEGPIIELHNNGVLQWTNAQTNAEYSLEWAPARDGAWQGWPDHERAPVTGEQMSIAVPMYFRLALNTNISKFVPPEGKVLMMIGQDTNNIDQYVASTGNEPGGVMVYTSVLNAEGLTSRFEDGGGPQFAQYLADRYSNSVIQVGLYMVDMLDEVLSGAADTSIDALGTWIQGTQRPVYLRIGYEFDADWAHYDTNDYRAAYRYIVDRFRAQGVDNVAYVWHSQAAFTLSNRMDWYPGDAYVDWVAASMFGSPSGPNAVNLKVVAEIARSLEKPFMLAECSPHGITAVSGVTSWTSWFDPSFDFIEEYNVKAFCYINCDWDAPEMWQFNTLGWGDARVQVDPVVKALWMQKMSHPKFLHAATNLFETLGYQ